MERYQEIERSIIKKYRKTIWCKFTKAVRDYELIQDNDNIMVCISGGKDSFLMAKCIEELKRHGKIDFNYRLVVMDPGYTKKHIDEIKHNAEILNLDIEIFKSDIFLAIDNMNTKSPCYMCARMRRGYLYNKAMETHCNKIALGHHFDDVIETNVLNMFYGGEIKTMLPKVHSKNFNGLELIRPLYYVREANIIYWAKYNHLQFLDCACKITRDIDNEFLSKRKKVKELLKDLRKDNEYIDASIFKSLENVNLDGVLGYKSNEVKHSFLDDY